MRFVPVALAMMMISALGAWAEPEVHMGPADRPEGAANLLASSRTSILIGTADHVQGWRSSYFHPSEFASKGNGEVRIEERLLVALDRARRDVGHPIRIVSGYRDAKHNIWVGGAPDSQHLHGTAVDLDLRGLGSYDRYRLMWFLIRHGFTSFGSYAGIRRCRIRIEMEGIFGIGSASSYWLGFSAHAVDWDRRFISETGYRSFLGLHGDPVPDIGPDGFATSVIERFVEGHLNGRLMPIGDGYRERIVARAR